VGDISGSVSFSCGYPDDLGHGNFGGCFSDRRRGARIRRQSLELPLVFPFFQRNVGRGLVSFTSADMRDERRNC